MQQKLKNKLTSLLSSHPLVKDITKDLTISGKMDDFKINSRIMDHAELTRLQSVKVFYAPGVVVLMDESPKTKSDKEMINELIKKSSRKIDDKEMG